MITLQELAEFLRNVAYSDNRVVKAYENRDNPNFPSKLEWSLRVVHPRTDKGGVGFSGGIWTDGLPRGGKDERWLSMSFSFEEGVGIYHFKRWNNIGEIYSTEKPSFEEFKDIVIKHFNVKKLYDSKE